MYGSLGWSGTCVRAVSRRGRSSCISLTARRIPGVASLFLEAFQAPWRPRSWARAHPSPPQFAAGPWHAAHSGRGGHTAGDAPLGLPGLRAGRRPSRVSLSRLDGFLGGPPSRRLGRRAVPAHGPRHGQRPLSQPQVARTPLTSPGDPEGLLRRGIPFSGLLATRAGLGGSPLLGGSDAAAPDQRHPVRV
ncbi:hypothetical protein NDU88_005605 [Pleurodeles waltl]|uniref:Uncharacterized protein n=1 Tax=Pleurodeles waltl TaxID=8319 RepID=A0AAV7SMA7_PLEWA|nr:hypothetical protein NDU88_005605 [Pleurodeles waltl]